MPHPAPLPLLPYCPSSLAEQLLSGGKKILLYGETGIGKSTLVSELARTLSEKTLTCSCISADPGSPGFGLPGTVSLGQWREPIWQVQAFEALCTLDAGRFRLPLLSAVNRLMQKAPPGLILVDAPGVTRGIAGSELLTGMVELLGIDTVVVLNRQSKPLPLMNELLSLGVRILPMHAHPEACRPGQKTRAHKRTHQWRSYLATGNEITISLSDLHLVGSPPPIDVPDTWTGRQCAFIDADQTVSIGEIIALQDTKLHIRLPAAAATTSTLLVRDARSEKNGLLGSAAPFAASNLQFLPPPDAMPYPTTDYSGGPRPAAKLRGLYATMINGVLGDPLLHLRLHQQQRSLLFDLGDSGRLPTRIAHQVSDVFISHAHIDHIGGFLWLLRSRVGDFPSCRLFGPPGLIGHIKGMIDGFLWDRIGDTGPRFEIAEIHGDRLLRARIQTGYRDCVALPEIQITEGLIVDDPLFSVRTVTLDHHTPVQAYAFESKAKFNVDNTALKTLNLTAGPWLNQLKQLIGAGDSKALIRLPDHSSRESGELAALLLTVTPGEKLVYATDLADTSANRTALTALAHKADFLFCEASFLEADIAQAHRTGHLTARACGEIATSADVKQLVPFHFSRRYEKDPEAVYMEISAACSRVILPQKNSNGD
ncbi:MAG: MBL fold metallo-hydrolase [Methylobacter sp.]|uniref:Clp1/GlmU family protein n=1 Tax=Methylobacter sp. TaxID=2051955 RepID=UPI0025F98C80|nr:Clp1/GlmU family protein [Methylobacter sp.]MCK9620141.1 MBL fold metallo-hydrolase [Methylobacter sp.]